MSNPTIGMFVGDQEIERRSSKSEGTVVQEIDRCVDCGHNDTDREGVCKHEIPHPKALYGNYPKRYCGCHCVFPSTSALPCKYGRKPNEYCFDCVKERHNEDMLDGRFDDAEVEDKTSVSALYKALKHALQTKHDIRTCACGQCEDARAVYVLATNPADGEQKG